jgi:hypothetical protein
VRDAGFEKYLQKHVPPVVRFLLNVLRSGEIAVADDADAERKPLPCRMKPKDLIEGPAQLWLRKSKCVAQKEFAMASDPNKAPNTKPLIAEMTRIGLRVANYQGNNHINFPSADDLKGLLRKKGYGSLLE